MIVSGRFSTFRAAERVARKFLSQGFTRQDISVFFTTPPGQHAQYPIGGDQYADPGAQLAARGAASWMSAGAIIGALAGTALYFILWRYWLIPIACLSVGAYIGSLIGALRRMREQTARSAHHGQDTGVMLAVHVAEENAVNAVQLLEKSGAADIEKATGIGEEDTMPYQNLEELPDSIKKHLPAHAQHIYKAAFNQAWDEYQDAARRRDDASREETAHKVAWSAVKNQYEKNNETGQWKSKKSF
ncbi:ChaB family protein [Candidatus Glomeribacter gigasporarum]|nr:putative cation transport regulator ChaB [Candidatus Glomeribacter gigasporarum]